MWIQAKIPGPSIPPDHRSQKERDPLLWNLGSLWLFPSGNSFFLLYIPPKKGLQIKESQKFVLMVTSGKVPKKPGVSPHLSGNRNVPTNLSLLTQSPPQTTHLSKRNGQERPEEIYWDLEQQ